MSGPRAGGSALTTAALRRPRRHYLAARILLDGGFAVFAIGAFLALGVNGGAGYQPPVPSASVGSGIALQAPVQTGQSVAVAAGVANQAPPLATPLVAPIPPPTPVAAVVLGAVSLVGVASMLAGLITTAVALFRRHYDERSPSTTKSSRRPV